MPSRNSSVSKVPSNGIGASHGRHTAAWSADQKRASGHAAPGAANHDPAEFSDPDQLDITRWPNKHVAFGYGPHFCLGAGLARLEAPIAFDTILRRLPNLALDTETVEWQNSLFRGPKVLPVRF